MKNSRNPVRLLLHVPVPWVYILSYLVGVGLQQVRPIPVPARILPELNIAGGALFLIGAVIAAWCLLIFAKQRTTTVPGRVSATVVTWGPYRFTRNPMYVALFIMYLGEAGLLHQAWPLAVLPFTMAYVNWVVIPVEEGRLREVFGEKYGQYCASVRRWI
jgi:protein-S-isoprenylcysteine O-methyltransferase Ste14